MAQSSIRIEGLNRLLARFDRASGGLIDKELMGEIGIFLVYSILDRTSKGEDVEGKPFEPYSPKYKLFREKSGRVTNIVNLFFHGSMLSSLTHEAFRNRVELFFMNTSGKTPSGKSSNVSNPEKAFFLNKNREFFAVSRDEEETIREMIQNHVREIMAGE